MKYAFLALVLAGCSDVGAVFLAPTGCRGSVNEGVTITQEKTPNGIKCTIEYRGAAK